MLPYIMMSLLFFGRYNGFCKGILWPVLHNVTSVYASHDNYDENAADSSAGASASAAATRAPQELGPRRQRHGRGPWKQAKENSVASG